MITISENTLKTLRENYTPGTRVQLDQMDDAQAPPKGTQGTVIGVDDEATIMVKWDNGSGLGVVYNVDICHII